MLSTFFQLKNNNTSVKTEITAGASTFLAMVYIIVVNPQILSVTGMDNGALFVATCLAAAMGSALMGLLANYPIALAPGMGINAFFTFTVVASMGYSWQIALGCIFWSGVLFVLLSLFKAREWIINTIPQCLKYAISAGIGLFLSVIALKNAGIIVGQDSTLVTLGNIKAFEPLAAVCGFFVICTLYVRKVKAAIIIGILLVTALGLLFGKLHYQGLMSMPPSIQPTLMQLDFKAILDVALWPVILSFLFVDLFDTSGTLIAVADKARLLDEKGQLPRVNKALMADSSATVIGAFLGTSSTTSYIESAAGVASGGKTGLTAMTTALLFLLALFFSPLASMIPAYATAPALLFVAVLMMSSLVNIDWKDVTEAAPAMITALMMPFSFSITEGIAMGFITYAVVKTLAGKSHKISWGIYLIAVLFVAKYAFL